MIVFPNAKINIGLNILRKRSDGYHDIESALVPVNWCDILEIVPAKGTDSTLTVTGNKVDCPTEKNLVMRAYRALNERIPLPPVDIYLRKIIPDGAGLGGGSADAAFTLSALNEMFALSLSKAQLADIAASLGADCPFFIYNRPMLATGTGTTLSPTVIPGLSGMSILIVKPDLHISTAEAYSGVTPGMPATNLTELLNTPVDQWQKNIRNDFEKSLIYKYNEIAELKERMIGLGAVYSSMSGSGSAVYGLFTNDKMAESARMQMSHCICHTCTLD